MFFYGGGGMGSQIILLIFLSRSFAVNVGAFSRSSQVRRSSQNADNCSVNASPESATFRKCNSPYIGGGLASQHGEASGD